MQKAVDFFRYEERDFFGRRVALNHFIDCGVIKKAFYSVLDMREIDYHATLVQFVAFTLD